MLTKTIIMEKSIYEEWMDIVLTIFHTANRPRGVSVLDTTQKDSSTSFSINLEHFCQL